MPRTVKGSIQHILDNNRCVIYLLHKPSSFALVAALGVQATVLPVHTRASS